MRLQHLYVLLLVGLGACAPAAPAPSEPNALTPQNTSASETTVQPTLDGGLSLPAAPAETASRPAWHSLPLVNARTGETFTFADFDGRTVYVEPMATWCTNCRTQMTNLRAAQSQISSEDYVFIAISVETNVSNETLAQYAADNGFDWIFAVATPEMLTALTEAFGRTISNPPSTPHFVIRPDGLMTGLVTGVHDPDTILALLQG